ncbi:LPXTG cell wall anchor domain-containing protein [Enterococcus faecalis]|nr:LPXTG cell wall anchor domain-containing protein [Enterococcus faecalis]
MKLLSVSLLCLGTLFCSSTSGSCVEVGDKGKGETVVNYIPSQNEPEYDPTSKKEGQNGTPKHWKIINSQKAALFPKTNELSGTWFSLIGGLLLTSFVFIIHKKGGKKHEEK